MLKLLDTLTPLSSLWSVFVAFLEYYQAAYSVPRNVQAVKMLTVGWVLLLHL